MYGTRDKNGKYITKNFTDEDKKFYQIGYNYFNGLDKKRKTLAYYEDNRLENYGLYSIEGYNNLTRGRQLQLDYGWRDACNEYVKKHIQPFLDEFHELENKYKVTTCVGNDQFDYMISIDGEQFDYYE